MNKTHPTPWSKIKIPITNDHLSEAKTTLLFVSHRQMFRLLHPCTTNLQRKQTLLSRVAHNVTSLVRNSDHRPQKYVTLPKLRWEDAINIWSHGTIFTFSSSIYGNNFYAIITTRECGQLTTCNNQYDNHDKDNDDDGEVCFDKSTISNLHSNKDFVPGDNYDKVNILDLITAYSDIKLSGFEACTCIRNIIVMVRRPSIIYIRVRPIRRCEIWSFEQRHNNTTNNNNDYQATWQCLYVIGSFAIVLSMIGSVNNFFLVVQARCGVCQKLRSGKSTPQRRDYKES